MSILNRTVNFILGFSTGILLLKLEENTYQEKQRCSQSANFHWTQMLMTGGMVRMTVTQHPATISDMNRPNSCTAGIWREREREMLMMR